MSYRIESHGDGADVQHADTWDEAVNVVASMMYFEPTEADRKEVREMLEEGFDGNDGWDGEYVFLQFEDGSIEVTNLETENV